MLISERKLRGIVKKALLESFGTEYGSGSSAASPAGTTVNGGGGYSYEVFPDGKREGFFKPYLEGCSHAISYAIS